MLMDRIAAVRIWTYIAHRGGWLKDALSWQAHTRQVENNLSDELHDKLTKQFVDIRTAHLIKRLKGDDLLSANVGEGGVVEVDGHRLGRLEGLRFRAERAGTRTANRAVLNAAAASLRPVIAGRVDAIESAENRAFTLGPDATIIWNGEEIATLIEGSGLTRPLVQVFNDDLLDVTARARVEDRLKTWLTTHVDYVLAPLVVSLGL